MLELPNKAASQGREQAAVTGITKRSGNVFADLGFQDAEMHALKAKLVRRIGEVIAENSLTQVEAAARMGLSQPDVSKMLRGQFRPAVARAASAVPSGPGPERDARIWPGSAERGAPESRMTVIGGVGAKAGVAGSILGARV